MPLSSVLLAASEATGSLMFLLKVAKRNLSQIIIAVCMLHSIIMACGGLVREAWAEKACWEVVAWWWEHDLHVPPG